MVLVSTGELKLRWWFAYDRYISICSILLLDSMPVSLSYTVTWDNLTREQFTSRIWGMLCRHLAHLFRHYLPSISLKAFGLTIHPPCPHSILLSTPSSSSSLSSTLWQGRWVPPYSKSIYYSWKPLACCNLCHTSGHGRGRATPFLLLIVRWHLLFVLRIPALAIPLRSSAHEAMHLLTLASAVGICVSSFHVSNCCLFRQTHASRIWYPWNSGYPACEHVSTQLHRGRGTVQLRD